MGGNNQIIKPSDERILTKLEKQQEEDHKLNRSGSGTRKTWCRAIVISLLLRDGKVEREDIGGKLEENQYLPPNLVFELNDVWEQVKAMVA